MTDRVEYIKTLVAAQNLEETQKVMHALIGPTGMMGATALCEYIAQVDADMKRDMCWPADPAWLGNVQELHEMTVAAMQPYLTSAASV